MKKEKRPFEKRNFKDWKSWQLAIMGGICLVGSSFTVYFLGRIWPLYMKAVEANEIFSWLGLIVSFYLAGISAMGIVFAAVSKRCGELLYQRHLD